MCSGCQAEKLMWRHLMEDDDEAEWVQNLHTQMLMMLQRWLMYAVVSGVCMYGTVLPSTSSTQQRH